MMAYSAPGFLVPDDLESALPPADEYLGPCRAASRRRPPHRAGRSGQSDLSRPGHGRGGAARRSASPGRMPRSWCAANPAPARKSSPATSTRTRRAPAARSSPSTAPRSPSNCLNPNCSAMNAARSPARSAQRIGKLEAAQNGTILLDEISEMDRRLQAKLLRAIAGTRNRPHRRACAGAAERPHHCNDQPRPGAGSRAADLPRRSVFPAERRLDPYAQPARPARRTSRRWPNTSSRNTARKTAASRASCQPAALKALMAHDWPGNVRELENTIHRAMVLTTDAVIGAEALEVGPPSTCRSGRVDARTRCRSRTSSAARCIRWSVTSSSARCGRPAATGPGPPPCLASRSGRCVTRSACMPRRASRCRQVAAAERRHARTP